MSFFNLFQAKNVCFDETSQSKTAVFLKLSQILSQNNPNLQAEDLFDAFWKRELLGSTAIGHGIILPHIRSQVINKPQAAFLKLKHPIDFSAEDKQPVDLVIGLVVPKQQDTEHLMLLQEICREFSKSALRAACRQATHSAELWRVLCHFSPVSTTPKP